jgi:hypothetical protein
MPARAFVERLRRPTAEQSTTEGVDLTIAFGASDRALSFPASCAATKKEKSRRREKRSAFPSALANVSIMS